jgi:integrase/recombinase XerD
MNTPTLGSIIYSYFEEHLKLRKGLLPSSVRSYRDTVRLFLHFVAQDTHKKITRIPLSELTAGRVLTFLESLEKQRHNQIRTRNQRLAALHTFFEHLADRIPEMLTEAERVAAIPHKRVPPPQTFFLERDEIDTLFSKMPKEGRFALRDHTLLLFLYNTVARVAEAADLRVANLDLGAQPRVRLHGKGDKWRVCPLWEQSSELLKRLLEEKHASAKPEQHRTLSGAPQRCTSWNRGWKSM